MEQIYKHYGVAATSIEKIATDVNGDNVYYDLSGKRIENPVQGIYIVNGQKRLVR
ncbi:MAG: hypothetical protein IKD40_07875 [Bacteroidaceae bacterium]|nr:hypothetical protein [Bacteroidaceae bacterium]